MGAEYRPVTLVTTPRERLRIHVFPDDFALSCDFNQSTGAPIADKSVVVGQPLSAADASAEQRKGRVAAILPDDLVGLGVQLHHSGIAATSDAVLSVIEDEKIPVPKLRGIVLVRKLTGTEPPFYVAGELVDDEDGAGLSEAQQEAPIPQFRNAVAVCPLMASLKGAYYFIGRVKVV